MILELFFMDYRCIAIVYGFTIQSLLIIHQILVDFIRQTAITVGDFFYPIQTKEWKN